MEGHDAYGSRLAMAERRMAAGARHTGPMPEESGASWAYACAVGAIGGVLGGLAMNAFTRVVASATGGHEAEGVAPGGARVGRGMQPPQAERHAEDDAAVRLASTVYRAVTGRKPGRRLRLDLGALAHYGFSAAAGVGYALLARRVPAVTRGWGTFYGSVVWATADETAMPALELSRGPREQSAGMHVYSLVGHWIYGMTLASVHRAARR